MKTMKHANRTVMSNERSKGEAYEMVGAGRLSSRIWKSGSEQKGWKYRFSVSRLHPLRGRESCLFSPADIPDLAQLAQRLAAVIHDDGCLDSDLRDDLGCLAYCLETVFRLPRCRPDRPLATDSPVVESLRTLIDYLWDDEARHFAESPGNRHVYRHLIALDAWLKGRGPDEGYRLAAVELDDAAVSDGGCPLCGRNDGSVDLHDGTWVVCHLHRLKWNSDDCERVPPRPGCEIDRSRNWLQTVSYRIVEPLRAAGSSHNALLET